MNNLIDKLSEKLVPVASKLGENKYLIVLRDAFMLSLPITMFGSLIVVLTNLPFFSGELQGTLYNLFGNGQNATMSIMTIFVTFGIGYYLSQTHKIEPIYGGAVSLASYLILTPFTAATESGEAMTGVLTLDRLGAKGMFVGMIAAFIAAEIYSRITKKGIVIKMPEGVPPAVAKSFAAMIPAIITLAIFTLLNGLVVNFGTNLHDIVYETIQQPLTGLGSSLPATLIAIFFVQLLWFFGLHGQIIVNSVMDPIWNPLMLDNLEAFESGKDLPHIVTKPFIEMYTVGMGGSGSTLIVVIILAFIMKSKQLKSVGRIALGPGIFNVNEPAIFGMPIVLNAAIFIPWVFAPIITTAFNYIVMDLGLFPIPTGVAVPWTVPVFFNGALATNSFMGGVLQLINMVMIGAIWYPFLKILDKQNLQAADVDMSKPE
ncbi:MAG: PTS cellobiose transporter subunit IIC [Atopostipes suicloacalis]|nr:PTS cellobiose transporter subunit IIC [Atopostipes suicloacalis]MDN6731273.1 PTS cellobiose transporter subunit IIC [Atopostipes suicloacalis]